MMLIWRPPEKLITSQLWLTSCSKWFMKSLAFRSLHSDRKYLLATGGVMWYAGHTSGSALQPLCPVISSYLTVVIIYFLKCSAELLCHSASALKVQVKTFVRFFFLALIIDLYVSVWRVCYLSQTWGCWFVFWQCKAIKTLIPFEVSWWDGPSSFPEAASRLIT